MNTPHNPPQPLLALTPELKESLEKRTKSKLLQIICKISGTTFFQEAPALLPLRDALGDAYLPRLSDGSENHELIYKFLSFVPLTTYDDYQPFVARFMDNQVPRLSDVDNLLSPGLPAFVAHTSGTSGGPPKFFLKYPDSRYRGMQWFGPDAPGIKHCVFIMINLNRWTAIVDDEGNPIQNIPVTVLSTGSIRVGLAPGPMDEAKIIGDKGPFTKFLIPNVYKTKLPIANFVTSPFAVWLLPSYHANLFMTTLFALVDPSLVVMYSTFSTLIYDAVRTIEGHWDAMVDAIQLGVLPDIYDLGQYRPHIEVCCSRYSEYIPHCFLLTPPFLFAGTF